MQSDKEEQKIEEIPEGGLMTEVKIGIWGREVGDSKIMGDSKIIFCSLILKLRITS